MNSSANRSGLLGRAERWAAPAAIFLLAAISIVGAFLGADGAAALFNSVPMGVCWSALCIVLLAASVFVGPVRNPATAAMHLGCAIVIIGGIWGSSAGHRLRNKLLGTQKVRRGKMHLAQGHLDNHLRDAGGALLPGRLPFAVKLEKFRIEYYPAGESRWTFYAAALAGDGQTKMQKIPWRVGESAPVPFSDASMRILTYVTSPADPVRVGLLPPPKVKIELTRGDRTVIGLLSGTEDSPQADLPLEFLYDNPSAWRADGSPTVLLHRPHQAVRDYKSTLVVLEGGREVARKVIEVNKPLHYGGYHFYQTRHFFTMGGRYGTILPVVSDSGLYVVYAGFAILCVGVAGRFWLGPILRAWRRRRRERGRR